MSGTEHAYNIEEPENSSIDYANLQKQALFYIFKLKSLEAQEKKFGVKNLREKVENLTAADVLLEGWNREVIKRAKDHLKKEDNALTELENSFRAIGQYKNRPKLETLDEKEKRVKKFLDLSLESLKKSESGDLVWFSSLSEEDFTRILAALEGLKEYLSFALPQGLPKNRNDEVLRNIIEISIEEIIKWLKRIPEIKKSIMLLGSYARRRFEEHTDAGGLAVDLISSETPLEFSDASTDRSGNVKSENQQTIVHLNTELYHLKQFLEEIKSQYFKISNNR